MSCRKLGLKTERHMEGYRIAAADLTKVAGLYEEYGLVDPGMNSMNWQSTTSDQGKS